MLLYFNTAKLYSSPSNRFFPSVFLFLSASRELDFVVIVRTYLPVASSIHNIYDPLNYSSRYELSNFQDDVPSFLRAPLLLQLFARSSTYALASQPRWNFQLYSDFREYWRSFRHWSPSLSFSFFLFRFLAASNECEVLFSPSPFLLERPYGTEIRFQLPRCQPSSTNRRRTETEKARKKRRSRDSFSIDILKRLETLSPFAKWFVFRVPVICANEKFFPNSETSCLRTCYSSGGCFV